MSPSLLQRGQATVEYLYVLPILLIMLLGAMQFVFIYEAKQTVNYATFVGTRNGALNKGSMASIQEGLASGLAPLFSHGTDLPALKLARKTARDELADDKLALIEIINPTSGALSEYANSQGEIPNDNLMYRPATAGSSGMNVQDANLLKVRVTYCVRLIVPLVNRMIYAFTVAKPTAPEKIDSSYSGGSIAAAEILKGPTPGSASGLCVSPSDAYPYRIPVTSEAVVRMQSPFADPGSWTAP